MDKQAAGPAKPGFLAALKDVVTNPNFLAALAAPAVAAGVSKAFDHRARLREAAAKTQAFRSMLDLHPHLKRRDQKEIGLIYNSLHNVNPVLARDPLVAGAWIDNIIENRGYDMNSHQALLNSVERMSGIRSQLASARKAEGVASINYGQQAADAVRAFGRDLREAQKGTLDAGWKSLKDSEAKAQADMEARYKKRVDHLQGKADAWAADLERREAELRAREEALNTKKASEVPKTQLREYFDALGL